LPGAATLVQLQYLFPQDVSVFTVVPPGFETGGKEVMVAQYHSDILTCESQALQQVQHRSHANQSILVSQDHPEVLPPPSSVGLFGLAKGVKGLRQRPFARFLENPQVFRFHRFAGSANQLFD
jgi:hypothetical protein